MLTPSQRELLAGTPVDALAERALASLYGLPGAPRMLPWVEDPLGLWPQWWQERAAASGMAIGADGLLQSDGRHWAVLQFAGTRSAFRLDGERQLQDRLDAAAGAARAAVPDLRELRAGVPLHAEAAAVQAHREINTIGWGSLAAVLLLAWLAFRSLRPILLVAGSLLIGCAAAVSATVAVFGEVQLLTLVFGASLVGVAEDYGIHWFACRQSGRERPWPLLRVLLPALLLALATSITAYLALGLAPFPGLRQMALFSVVGLTAAFLTVICWFPWLDRGEVKTNAFSEALGRSLARWPRVDGRRGWQLAGVLALAFSIAGIIQLRPLDDLRSLQSSPPELIEQQRQIGELLGMPSPAQFFLVQGEDAESVLQREEALTARLRALEAEGRIGGHRAASDWLPSRRQQAADAALAARIEPEVIRRVATALDEPLAHEAAAMTPMPEVEAWLADPASEPARMLWLGRLGDGQASVVMIEGLSRAGALDALRAATEGLPGVRWVDRTRDYSELLGHYRRMMSWLLVAGLVAVGALLAWRHRADAWRTLAPTVLAGLLALAVLGWTGQPLQLFNVLALLLLLGMGIDYGIFLTEHRGEPGAWLAVCVGGASTWLSFGLLALSSTPALHAFGLTLLLGIGLVWLISPLFRPLHCTPPDPVPGEPEHEPARRIQ